MEGLAEGHEGLGVQALDQKPRLHVGVAEKAAVHGYNLFPVGTPTDDYSARAPRLVGAGNKSQWEREDRRGPREPAWLD